MSILNTIGRMLLGGAIRRAMWRSPRAALIVAAIAGLLLLIASAMPVNAQQRYPTRAEAYAACQAQNAFNVPPGECRHPNEAPPWRQYLLWHPGNPIQARFYYDDDTCPANAPWNEELGRCEQNCTSKPDITVSRPPFSPAGGTAPNQFAQCVSGCAVTFQNMHDGTFVGVHGSNAVCDTPGQPETPTCTAMGMVSGIWGCMPAPRECGPGQFKDAITGECSGEVCPAGMSVGVDGACKPDAPTCPPGQIKSPNGGCLPGEGMCAAGEARGADGTCKKDSDGDGKPDGENENGEDEDGNKFSGGDSCDKPPSCSGNPVMCGQARIQWRIDCNTRTKANISGGSCAAVPVCTGDGCKPLEYQQLVQQWKTACALEKLAGQGTSPGEGGQPAWTRVDGMNQNAGAGVGDGDQPKLNDSVVDGSNLDTSGFTGGGSCVGFMGNMGGGQLMTGFTARLASPPAFWCDYIGWIKLVLITVATIGTVIWQARG